jgi:hypothetical protein
MAGGKLRDGAYEGFPLGANAVILNRYNSYLSVGPEPESPEANTGGYIFYEGFLIGPSSGSPRIEWNASGNGALSYVEVRPGEIATNAQLTAKKSVGLIYSVWFVDNATLTIDAAGEAVEIFEGGAHGIQANGGTFKFYGSGSNTIITIKAGNFLDGRFLDSSETASPVGGASDITISGPGITGTEVEYGDGTNIKGRLITYTPA